MIFKSRKLLVWLMSVAGVLVIYLLVTQLSETPEIEFDRGGEIAGAGDDFLGDIEKIGDVGVASVKNPRFEHRNEDGEVDRVQGFEELLNKRGDLWEIKKPYMNIFRRSFRCYLTADIGNVLFEPGITPPNLKDAILTGNVVVHILPEEGGGVQESRVYLDDIAFVSDRSLFSTAGPVRLVSENVRMAGRGMELVYNADSDRVEFLRIIELENLRLRQSSRAGLFGGRAGGESTGSLPGEAKLQDEATTKQQDERYRCIFRKNVVIDTAEQLVFADEVFVDDIIFAKTSGEESIRAGSDDMNGVETVDSGVSIASEVNEPAGDFNDAVVTCEGGIVAFGMEYRKKYEDSIRLEPEANADDSQSAERLNDAAERTTLVARRIDYSALSGDTAADGPSEITFYADDVMGGEGEGGVVPIKITTQRRAEFLPASNQVVFEGDCLCAMDRKDANGQQRYTLSAPKLTVDLSKEETSAADIEYLRADGGTVRLASVKRAGGKLLGGIELRCSRFDYEAGEQVFTAFGPGVMKVDNSNMSEANSEAGRFSLQKPCWATVEGFDTLQYYFESNRIVAAAKDAEREKIVVSYVPIVDGRYGKVVKVTASSIEGVLCESGEGQSELSTLSAGGGVVYADEDKKLEGSEFFYDAKKSMITIWSDDGEPCYFNGNPVKKIEYDLKNDKVNAEVVGPGVLQIKR